MKRGEEKRLTELRQWLKLALVSMVLAGVTELRGTEASVGIVYDPQGASGVGRTVAGAMPLQTVDAEATGEGALTVAELEAQAGIFVNAYWRDGVSGVQFAQAQGQARTRNYLAFSDANGYGVRTAVQFKFEQGSRDGVFNGGFNSTGPRIVFSASETLFLEQALHFGGGFEIVLGSYGRKAADEAGFGFRPQDAAGNVYAARVVGFVVTGVQAGESVVAELYGSDGRLLSTLTGISVGETTAGENAAGGEVFFGYDAGNDPLNWVHRVVLLGGGPYNMGFDDFAFTPVAAVSAAGEIVLPVHADTQHYWAFIEAAGTGLAGVGNYGAAAVAGEPRFSESTMGGYATDGSGALRINGVDYGTVLTQSVVNLGAGIVGEAWFRWDLEWSYATVPPQPRDVFLIHRADGVAGNIFRLAVEDPTSPTAGVNLYFDGTGVGGGRLLADTLENVASGISFIYGVVWNEAGALESLSAYLSTDGGATYRNLNATLGSPVAANLGEIRIHAKGDFSGADDWLKIHGLWVASTADGVGLPEQPVAVDPLNVFVDRPLWAKFADKDLVAGQGIDIIAAGVGAATPEQLEALEGIGINTEFAGFRRIRDTDTNYLYYNSMVAGIQLKLADDPELGDEWAGIATHTDALNVSGPAGPQERHGVYLGILNETWGSYTLTLGTIVRDMFYRADADGNPFGARAVGFVVANLLEGGTLYADFYSVSGELLTTLEANGANGLPMSMAGDEVFFGYDAGENPLNWIHRVVLRGQMPGQAGFDDLGFTPIYAIAADGSLVEPPSFIDSEMELAGLVVDAPLYNFFGSRNVLPTQLVKAVASGAGARSVAEMETLPGMRVNTDWDVAGERFAGKANRPVAHNALHYTDTDSGVVFTLNHLGLGSNPNSGATTAGLREMVSRPNAVYVGFLDAGFVEYTMTMGRYDAERELFLTTDAEGRPLVARGVGFILSGINDGAVIVAEFFNSAGESLAVLTGTGTNVDGGNGIEIFYGYDAGPEEDNWIRKVVISGINTHPTGGSQNVGMDDFGFTPITALGVDAVELRPWTELAYPLNEAGWRMVAVGEVMDAYYPWVYHSGMGGWCYFAPESGIYSQYIYSYVSGEWLHVSELWGEFFWNYTSGAWNGLE